MSKYMQLTVHVRSYYSKELGTDFPRLARYLAQYDPGWMERSPSFFEIAGRLDKLLYAFEGTDLRGLFLRHEGELRKLHKGIEERIADWRLADADKLLYKLEDIFELIEADLS